MYNLGRYDEAMVAYEGAMRLTPEDPVLRTAYSQAQRAVRRTTTDQRLRLRDGRWLGYVDYGDPDGMPIICCHGTPGSRLDAFGYEDLLRDLHIRLIVPDRPGYGLSSFQRRRRLLDWPSDVKQLADQLDLERFAVLGVSGGGPHALACAAVLGPRLTSVGVVSSAAPRKPALRFARGRPRELLGFVVERLLPWPMQQGFNAVVARSINASPEFYLQVTQRYTAPIPPKKQGKRRSPAPAVPAHLAPTLREEIREPYRQGGRGHAWDGRLFWRPWGFRLKDLVGVPIYLWHGERDALAPGEMGHALAKAIPGCRATFYADEGHDVIVTHLREILATLAAPCGGSATRAGSVAS